MIDTTIIGTDDITLNEVKRHLNITDNDDDTYLTALIGVSLDAVESYCRQQFLLRQNAQTLGTLKTGSVPVRLMSDITYRPVDDSVELCYELSASAVCLPIPKRDSMNYTDDNHHYINNYIVVELSEAYEADIDSEIVLNWKTGLTVIPEGIGHARLLLIGTYYENREDTVTSVHTETIPTGIAFLLEAYIAPQVG